MPFEQKNKLDHAHLVKMKISNIGCIDEKGIEIDLDNIVCLVGANNAGKSTVLDAYELALTINSNLPEEKFNNKDKPASVELWVHIPEGTKNIADDWIFSEGNKRLVLSKWEWNNGDGDRDGNGKNKPKRTTWNPSKNQFDSDAKASGLDTVFSSKLPQPLRIRALKDPKTLQEELSKLLENAIKSTINNDKQNNESDLAKALKQLETILFEKTESQKEKINRFQESANTLLSAVFPGTKVLLQNDCEINDIDLQKSISSRIVIGDTFANKEIDLQYQGTGTQRALFWSMIRIVNELQKDEKKKEKDKKSSKGKAKDSDQNGSESVKETDIVLPSYILLIDEPEVALHPSAVRAAKELLYELAEREDGFQVMLTTHHPSFIDPLKDHTTIVRLNRSLKGNSTNVFSAEEASFSVQEKEELRAHMTFDSHLAEIFFCARDNQIIVVEGDTEYAAFQTVMNQKEKWHFGERPLIVRARGKATIVPLVKMLGHFKVDFSVLHDVDTEKTRDEKTNPAWTVNKNILNAIKDVRTDYRVNVIHRVCDDCFETKHDLEKAKSKDGKPYNVYKQLMSNKNLIDKVTKTLKDMIDGSSDPTDSNDASQHKKFTVFRSPT